MVIHKTTQDRVLGRQLNWSLFRSYGYVEGICHVAGMMASKSRMVRLQLQILLGHKMFL